MEKILRKFFSIEMMTLGLLTFLISIARATFIESDYGTQASKAVVYNTWWFETLLVYLGINLIVNIFRYKMFKKEKIAVLSFHLAFILILIGAGVTRYISFEGIMPIREGSQSNTIYSNDGYLQVLAHDNTTQYEMSKRLYLADIANNDFTVKFKKPNTDEKVEIDYSNFIPNAVDKLVKNAPDGTVVLEIVIPGPRGMDTNYVERGSYFEKNGFLLSFDYPNPPAGSVQITQSPNGFEMFSTTPIQYMQMSDKARGVIPADTLYTFYQGRLYTINGNNFVFKTFHRKAKLIKVKSPEKEMGKDILYVTIKSGGKDTLIGLEGGQGKIATPSYFLFDGLSYKVGYGALPVQIPFYVALRDFRLEKYPGSESPSSYLSDLTVIDDANNVKFDKRVFMNHVMDYNGYRFFQSSYDPDELGTRLSVNQDTWGTNISYLGYLLMSIGMIMTLFSPNTRFRELSKKIDNIHIKKASLILIMAFFSGFGFTQDSTTNNVLDHGGHSHKEEGIPNEEHEEHNHVSDKVTLSLKNLTPAQIKFNETPISLEHIKNFESLLAQNSEGRIVPINTMAMEILHKVYRAEDYKGLSPTQVFLDMLINPTYWMDQPIILVSNPVIQQKLHLDGKYATFRQFFNEETGEYIFQKEVEGALQKAGKQQDELDKQYLKVNERVQVLNMTFLYNFFNVIPVKEAHNNKWYSPMDKDVPYNNLDSLVPRMIFTYLTDVVKGKQTGDYKSADEWLNNLKAYQRKVANDICPSEGRVNAEIFYNKIHLNQNLAMVYILLGFLLLLIFFFRVFTKEIKWTNWPNKILASIMFIVFILHGVGLGMRWYISQHAPWSDGYEAIIFIAWVGVLAGFFFSIKSKVTLGATALLAFFMLFVAHMNQLDPQITNLVPVLKSYWLMIHVAVITGSYGFLGLGAILAIINMFLFIFRTKKNGKRVTLNISEITYVSEMTITVGLFMLTIGTFLGGIWANESWGRYWGWDPKETWALVSILAYAIVLHLRMIPKLSGKLMFNSATMWAYSMIIFTYLGVNFFLVGLHSYANGEADKMWPTSVIVTIICFVIFNIIAIIRNHQYLSAKKN